MLRKKDAELEIKQETLAQQTQSLERAIAACQSGQVQVCKTESERSEAQLQLTAAKASLKSLRTKVTSSKQKLSKLQSAVSSPLPYHYFSRDIAPFTLSRFQLDHRTSAAEALKIKKKALEAQEADATEETEQATQLLAKEHKDCRAQLAEYRAACAALDALNSSGVECLESTVSAQAATMVSETQETLRPCMFSLTVEWLRLNTIRSTTSKWVSDM